MQLKNLPNTQKKWKHNLTPPVKLRGTDIPWEIGLCWNQYQEKIFIKFCWKCCKRQLLEFPIKKFMSANFLKKIADKFLNILIQKSNFASFQTVISLNCWQHFLKYLSFQAELCKLENYNWSNLLTSPSRIFLFWSNTLQGLRNET